MRNSGYPELRRDAAVEPDKAAQGQTRDRNHQLATHTTPFQLHTSSYIVGTIDSSSPVSQSSIRIPYHVHAA